MGVPLCVRNWCQAHDGAANVRNWSCETQKRSKVQTCHKFLVSWPPGRLCDRKWRLLVFVGCGWKKLQVLRWPYKSRLQVSWFSLLFISVLNFAPAMCPAAWSLQMHLPKMEWRHQAMIAMIVSFPKRSSKGVECRLHLPWKRASTKYRLDFDPSLFLAFSMPFLISNLGFLWDFCWEGH